MRALRYHKDATGLKVDDVPDLPQPEGNDVLIRVKATSLTKGELEWPETKAREFPIPGHDVAGIIEAVGPNVSGFEVNDEIFALTSFTRDGAAATHQLVSANDLAVKPPSLTFAEAASIPLSALTAYQALFTHAEAQPGQRVLVNGAGGGVGVMAVQVAAAEQMIITAVCSGQKREMVRSLGAHEVVNYRSTPLSSLSSNYDIAIDCVGSPNLSQCFALLKGGGKLICVARPATKEEKAQRPDVSAMFFIVDPDGDELTKIAQCVEQDLLRPVVQEVLPLEDGVKAWEMVESGHSTGKVVLSVEGDEGEVGRRVDSPQQGQRVR